MRPSDMGGGGRVMGLASDGGRVMEGGRASGDGRWSWQ